jgi:hypothetical protein
MKRLLIAVLVLAGIAFAQTQADRISFKALIGRAAGDDICSSGVRCDLFGAAVDVTTLVIGGGTSLTTSNVTGTGNIVLATSPTLTTPNIGVATATSIAIGGGTALATSNQSGTGSIAMTTSPTFVTPTLGAASATSIAIGGGSALTTSNQTGTGNLVLATSPTLTTHMLCCSGWCGNDCGGGYHGDGLDHGSDGQLANHPDAR